MSENQQEPEQVDKKRPKLTREQVLNMVKKIKGSESEVELQDQLVKDQIKRALTGLSGET